MQIDQTVVVEEEAEISEPYPNLTFVRVKTHCLNKSKKNLITI